MTKTSNVLTALVFVCWGLLIPNALAAKLQPATQQAFEHYVQTAEARWQAGQDAGGKFLWVEETPDRMRSVRQGLVVVEPASGNGEIAIPDGSIHDWIGAVFVPGVTIDKTLAVLQNYGNHKKIYPEVIDSRILEHQGNRYRVYLRLLKKKVLTVVLNTEHDVEYIPISRTRWRSRSYSTRIAEVRDPGTSTEREQPVGDDHGFLWRLYSYWEFEERDGGVFLECREISLTRDIPTGLGWLVQPIIRSLPRESLTKTLEATRGALLKK